MLPEPGLSPDTPQTPPLLPVTDIWNSNSLQLIFWHFWMSIFFSWSSDKLRSMAGCAVSVSITIMSDCVATGSHIDRTSKFLFSHLFWIIQVYSLYILLQEVSFDQIRIWRSCTFSISEQKFDIFGFPSPRIYPHEYQMKLSIVPCHLQHPTNTTKKWRLKPIIWKPIKCTLW